MSYLRDIIVAGGICSGFLLVGIFLGFGMSAYAARTRALAEYTERLKAELDKIRS